MDRAWRQGKQAWGCTHLVGCLVLLVPQQLPAVLEDDVCQAARMGAAAGPGTLPERAGEVGAEAALVGSMAAGRAGLPPLPNKLSLSAAAVAASYLR